MYHRPKIFLLCLILLQIRLYCSLPTINQPFLDSRNYLSPNEKHSLFKPPELEETIEEVQRILAQDPSLPRLTRGEIEELYEKVTREEYQKSVAAGDMGRADSMRALMLVLPYNTDNNTEENIQELYTRPPVTKVIDAYTPHQPIKFLTPDPSAPLKTETAPAGDFAATTYKPAYSLKTQKVFAPNPTTYHPPPPAPVMFKMTSSVQQEPSGGFQPVTNSINDGDYRTSVERNPTPKPVQRYSSHYNAKTAEFLKQRKPAKHETSTVRPVADVLESLGIVGQTQSRNRFPIDDYYAAESAPQPVISTYVPQTVSLTDLKELQAYNLSPKIRPDAYSSFKPLNIGEEIRVKPEVEGYLTRFGIVGGRKKKDLKKGNNLKGHNAELTAGESEISTAKVPRRGTAAAASTELEKLLENLQELERLNVNPKALGPTTTIRPTTSSTTTTTTTPAPTTPNLITNGAPMLIEPKKPRRRIDPNIDINFGNTGNHQTEAPNTDQLSKLLENLQELEKLRIKPDNALKTIAPATNAARTGPLQYATPTPRTVNLLNRFNELAPQTTPAPRSSAQADAAQLQDVLRQLQAFELQNARTTTKKPKAQPARAGGGLLAGLGGLGGALAPTDVFNLQKLLTDDRELERLYEQARAKQTGRKVTTTTTAKPTTTTTQRALILGDLDDSELQRLFEQARARTSTTAAPTTTTTTTTSTSRTPAPSYREFEQLQKYFAELERTRTSTSTSTTTTTTTTTSTTTPAPTTTTTPSTTTTTTTLPTTTTTTTTTAAPVPAVSSLDLAQRITDSLGAQKPKKAESDNAQLQELINRVQQLERLNAKNEKSIRATTTDTPIPFVGFTTRKVNAPSSGKSNEQRTPSNDFAHLQELYQHVASAEQDAFGRIEISTAATAAKPSAKRTQKFAQKIIDITNDTGSGSSLQEVEPNEFVQLQKLLSKVKELERVKIHGVHGIVQPATPAPTVGSYTRDFTDLTNLVTSASVHTPTVHNSNGAHIVYPEKTHEYKPFEDILKADYREPIETKTHVGKKDSAVLEPTSSEELRELAMSVPANPKGSSYDKDFEQYQEFFKQLEDDERTSYKNMQPPVIYKTVTKEPPRFVVAHKPHEMQKPSNGNVQQKADLEELQKLLSNAQELEKLGVTLPTELSDQIETKLTKHASNERAEKQLETVTTQPVHIVTAERPKPSLALHDLINHGSKAPSVERKENNIGYAVVTPESTSAENDIQDSSEKEAFFSLTTPKSLVPKEPKSTTPSTLDLPVFSATKIIEAAIKRAANKIGVSTEQTLGFQKRSDTDIYADMDPGSMDDLMGEFSEMNYQLASPDVAVSGAIPSKQETVGMDQTTTAADDADITQDLHELQRLIGNLQELQRLNLTVSSELLRQADAKYLETLKKQQTPADDTTKNRRQSVTPAVSGATDEAGTSTTPSASTSSSEQSASVDDADIAPDPVDIAAAANTNSATADKVSNDSSSTTTTEEPRNGSLADLEESFGGSDTNKEEPKPPKRKNGFYFLADWNSFLEVGDGDDQVIVRLSPKIGDPRLFIPVKIP